MSPIMKSHLMFSQGYQKFHLSNSKNTLYAHVYINDYSEILNELIYFNQDRII